MLGVQSMICLPLCADLKSLEDSELGCKTRPRIIVALLVFLPAALLRTSRSCQDDVDANRRLLPICAIMTCVPT